MKKVSIILFAWMGLTIFISGCHPFVGENCTDKKIELLPAQSMDGKLKYGVYPFGETFATVEKVPKQPGRGRDLAILEILLRRAMAAHRDIKEWYIDLEGLGVSENFLQRFEDIPLSIYPRSDAYQNEITGRIYNKETNRSGVLAVAVITQWTNDFTAKVEYGYYMHAQGAEFIVGTIKLENNMWIFDLEGSRYF